MDIVWLPLTTAGEVEEDEEEGEEDDEDAEAKGLLDRTEEEVCF